MSGTLSGGVNKNKSLSLGRSEEELDTIITTTQTSSFWDIGNYRKVVKTIEDGAKLCGDLAKMVQERADIESKYSKQLQGWSKKWEELIRKGPEYGGSLSNGWKSLLVEASRQSDIHEELSKNIRDLSKSITKWQSYHYHKTISGRLKEGKTAEEGFHSAQKPWEKLLSRCNKFKKNYHHISSELQTVNNTLDDSCVHPIEMEQLVKLREKKEKFEKERDKIEEKYQSALTAIFHDKDRYVEEMNSQFEKCQVLEKIRMEFFKETLFKLKDIVDLSKDERISCIYQVCTHTLEQINSTDDLQWYSLHHGPDMAYNWPVFEEFHFSSVQSTDIQPRASLSTPSSNYSLNSKLSESYDDNSLPNSPSHDINTNPISMIPSHDINTNPISMIPSHDIDQHTSDSDLNMSNTDIIIDHIYESTDDWPEPSSPPTGLTMNTGQRILPEEGILMRALYEYSGVDEDDLSFAEGDVLRFLEYCDGGWVKALHREDYGYVPEAYFEPLI